MAESPIEHVMDTAFWVATYRADEGLRSDALFADPLAARLVEGRGRAIAAGMTGTAITSWLVVLRTRIIDELILTAVADGVDTVLNLGAGLDTRPYRMDLPSSLRWIEVDFDATIAFKEARLASEQPRCQLSRRKVDLSDGSARKALLAEVDASARRILVLTEGVVLYLSNEQVAELAADLHRCRHIERWILEYLGPKALWGRDLVVRGRRRQLVRAPFRFRPENWTTFFDGLGWTAAEVRYLAEEGERLGRAPPLPLWLRIGFRLLPRIARDAFQRQYGYAVLERKA